MKKVSLSCKMGRDVFYEPLTIRSSIILTVVLLSALFLEMAAYQNVPGLIWLVPRLWLAVALLCAFAIVAKGLLRLYSDLRQKKILPLILLLAVTALLLWPLFDRSRSVIGQDATQQLAAGLAAYQEADWRYTGQAFLNYPSRQYLLAALPALLLGRTETALQIGFAWPFWLGLILFADSLRNWAQDRAPRHGDALALVTVTAVFVFPYVTEYYLYFEHTLFPLCFALQTIGWLLLFMQRPSLGHALALTWTGSMLIYCYTTALAVVLLLIFFLMVFFCVILFTGRLKKETAAAHYINPADNAFFAWACLLIAVTIGLAFLFSVLFGRGDRVTVLRSSQAAELLQAALAGLRIAFWHDPAVYASVYLPFVWLYLGAGLTFLLGRYHAVIAAWTVGVFILSQVLQGYAIYPAPISFSRTLVTVPVLLTAWFLVCTDPDKAGLARRIAAWRPTALLRACKRLDCAKGLLGVVIALNLALGFSHIAKPLVQGDAAKYFYPAPLQQMQLLISDLNQRARQENLTQQDTFTFILYTDNIWLKNPADYTGYFFPHARVEVLASGQSLPADLDWQRPILIYIRDGEPGEMPRENRQIECRMLPLSPDSSVALQRVIFRPDQAKE